MNLKKWATRAILTPIVAIGIHAMAVQPLNLPGNFNAFRYVRNHSDEIFKQETDKLKVTGLKKPDISYDYLLWTPIEVYFKIDKDKNAITFSYELSSWSPAAHYEVGADEVIVNLPSVYESSPNKPNILESTLRTLRVRNRRLSIEKALRHEFMHAIADQLHQRDRNGANWPTLGNNPRQNLATMLVSEGMAEYAASADETGMLYVENGVKSDICPYENWPKDTRTIDELAENVLKPLAEVENRTTRFLYHGGFCLARHVVKNHGVRGIKYLMENPPTERDLVGGIPAYQGRVLRALEKAK